MSNVSKNIIANFIGKFWTASIGLIVVPLYIKFLGIESYGLVGFYATLIGTMNLLDFGLSTTLNKELASAKALGKSASQIKNLVYTLEVVYWLIGALICIFFCSMASFIGTHWIKSEHLPTETVIQAIRLMGCIVLFQWPISLYNGGLYGLERQVFDNVLNVILSTIRALGAVFFLWFVSPTIIMFFTWQVITTAFYVFILRYGLWRYLPKSSTVKKFSKVELTHIWAFAAGMTGISLVTFFLNQLDKIVLSKVLPLSQYAYYTLAFTVASGVNMIIGPINSATFPRMSSLVANNDRTELVKFYHETCKFVSTIVSIVGLFIVFFTKDVLMLWLNDPATVNQSITLTQIIVSGTICNSLAFVPYFMLLAHGITRFTLIQNVVASIITVPLLFLLVHYYGATGAACVWFIVNFGCLLISIPMMHNLALKGESSRWYIHDTLIPFICPLIGYGLFKWANAVFFGEQVLSLVMLIFIFIVVAISSLLSAKAVRQRLRMLWYKFRAA